jgi:hypothetical protein
MLYYKFKKVSHIKFLALGSIIRAIVASIKVKLTVDASLKIKLKDYVNLLALVAISVP